ncbi:MAG: leucine--tRNA ligase [Candidatus Marsarchaeota archaeon]|nr:leucine--tRNA ligase [Candidatus Marsarchaeota archaeon]
MLDYKAMEKKWRKKWEEAKIFEAEPSEGDGMLVTGAWPYVNAPQHIGHLRTYGTADVYARYMRMRGHNVLYSMGIHATGTPVFAFARRIAANDRDIFEELSMFHIPEDTIRSMVDPKVILDYFTPLTIESMKEAGYSIDWRRMFISIDPLYSKMVEWQFSKLKEKGYLVTGRHPVGWCPNDNNAVGQHDTMHAAQPEIEALAAVKFKEPSSGVSFLCMTYRPETLYAATNLFINTSAKYITAEIGGEKYYISEESFKAISYQMNVKKIGEITAEELLKKSAINPLTNESLPVLPGFFVKPEVGTGIVMSVPAHAPFDYAALEKLRGEGHGLPYTQYKAAIAIEGQDAVDGMVPALAYIEAAGGSTMPSNEILEEATKRLYKDESHKGVMLVGEYKGMKESEARDKIKEKLIASKDALEMYALTNDDPVVCRCGANVVVKVVTDQWFINYGDEKWKAEVRAQLGNIKIYPEKMRTAYKNTVDWINLRATERAQGFGTRFPLNPNHIIESLSDSTIYMMFYTFVHILKAHGVKAEQLKPEFFDYIIDGRGDPDSVAKTTGIDFSVIKRCKESLDYWYTSTSRHSAHELIPSHLTMYIFNHIAVTPEKFWPKQIVTNGMVNYEGEKMSKSLGNVVPLADGIEKYSADALRFTEIAGSDLISDGEFSPVVAQSIILKNEYLLGVADSLKDMKSSELTRVDYWLYSKLNSKIKRATENMDTLDFRDAYVDIYYNSMIEIKQYTDMGGANRLVLQEFMEDIALMLSPIMPHISEELWHRLGKDTFSSKEKWPSPNDDMVNEGIEQMQQMVFDTAADAAEAIKLTAKMKGNEGKNPEIVRIVISDDWKISAYNALLKTGSISEALKAPGIDEMDKEAVSKFLAPIAKRIHGAPRIDFSQDEMLSAFAESKVYLEAKLGAKVLIERERDSKSQRAARAAPQKPSIDIEWR